MDTIPAKGQLRYLSLRAGQNLALFPRTTYKRIRPCSFLAPRSISSHSLEDLICHAAAAAIGHGAFTVVISDSDSF